MKAGLSIYILATAVSFFLLPSAASAAVQNIAASSYKGTSTPGKAIATSSSVITCTAASGGINGTICHITSPGWTGLVPVGESVGTSGAGNVTLRCNGQYSANGGSLSCAARIDDVLCSPEQAVSASSNANGSDWGYAPIKGAAIVQCTQASGSVSISPSCSVQVPGYSGGLAVGSSIAATGAGTVFLKCNGMYSANGGGLNCAAQVSQVCP